MSLKQYSVKDEQELTLAFKDPRVCMHAKLLQSCLTLCNPMDYSLPGSSVHGILQAGILEWFAMLSSRGSFQPRNRTHISGIGRRVLYH